MKPVAKSAAATPKPQTTAKAPAKKVQKTSVKPATKTAAVVKKPVVAKAKQAPQSPGQPVKKVPAPKPVKIKMVRDSFTFPATEHAQLVELKKRVIALGREVKKGELVRLGITVLSGMTDAALLDGVSKVDRMKAGRPKK